MSKIVLNNIKVRENKLIYEYSVSENLKKFFNLDNEYIIEYYLCDKPLIISQVPENVLIIPFMCNILPVVWLSNAELIVKDVDADFFESINKFKQGYSEMYPEAKFLGRIQVEKIEHNKGTNSNKCGMFFSAGMDAYCSLANHYEEKPDLLSIWGSDIDINNSEGWAVLENMLMSAAQEFQLPLLVIKSSFRKILNCNELTRSFEPVLHDEWWHGIQHGPAIIGHAAPIAYVRGYKRQYIASSFSKEDGRVTCSSYPTIDNYINYAGCNTIHDGFEFTRQEKAKVIHDFYIKTKKKIFLHVCWKEEDGNNCCRCEKCLRTIAEFLAFGVDPQGYGLKCDKETMKYMKKYIKYEFDYNPYLVKLWLQIQREFKNNKKILKGTYNYRAMKWIEKIDFNNPNKKFCRMIYNMKKIINKKIRELVTLL